MRPAGVTLAVLLIGVSAAWSQQPGVPAAPGTPPPLPGAAVPAAPALDAHLGGWEKTMGGLTNFFVELDLTRKDAVFGKEKGYKGSVLCMKPNFARMRLDYTGDPTKTEYEAFICNGKSVYAYDGQAKTITEWKLPDPKANPAGATDNLMLDFLGGMKSKDAKTRFDLTLFKEDAHYVYLDIKPLMPKDKQEFQQLRLALYGPKTEFAYLPAQVYLVKPNGDSEQWKFTKPQTNLKGITEKEFQFVPVKGFAIRQGQAAPPQPAARPGQPVLPGAPGLPAGPGAVRPNK